MPAAWLKRIQNFHPTGQKFFEKHMQFSGLAQAAPVYNCFYGKNFIYVDFWVENSTQIPPKFHPNLGVRKLTKIVLVIFNSMFYNICTMTENLLQCTKCKLDKPSSDFYKDSSKKRGFRYHCKACESKKSQHESETTETLEHVKLLELEVSTLKKTVADQSLKIDELTRCIVALNDKIEKYHKESLFSS